MSGKVNVVDINSNSKFDKLFIDILLRRYDSEALDKITKYSSEKIMEMLRILAKPLQDTLLLYYGLPNGTPQTLAQVGKELGISGQGARNRLDKALDELAKPARLYGILGKENSITLSTSLRDLIWSERVIRGLIRSGINTVGDLILKDKNAIGNIRNIGEVSLSEILAKINEIYEISPEARKVIDDKNEQGFKLEVDNHINSLNLPRTLYNGLIRNDITTIEDLLKVDEETLRKIRAFGDKKVQEILEIRAGLFALYPDLAKKYSLPSQKEEIFTIDASIVDLNLPPYICKTLVRAEITKIRQLVMVEDFRTISGIGEKSAEAIQKRLAEVTIEEPSELESLKAEKQDLLEEEKVMLEKEKRAKALTNAFAALYADRTKENKVLGD